MSHEALVEHPRSYVRRLVGAAPRTGAAPLRVLVALALLFSAAASVVVGPQAASAAPATPPAVLGDTTPILGSGTPNQDCSALTGDAKKTCEDSQGGKVLPPSTTTTTAKAGGGSTGSGDKAADDKTKVCDDIKDAAQKATCKTVAPGTDSTPSNSTEGDDLQDTAWSGLNGFIAKGAMDALDLTMDALNKGLKPQVATPNSWFTTEYHTMLVVGVWILVPMILVAIIHAVAKGSMHMLLRAVLVSLPISIIGATVAVEIVQLLLNITDDFAAVFQGSIEGDIGKFALALKQGIGGDEGNIMNGLPIMLSIFLAIGLIFASVLLFLVLMMREASIYIATVFLPLGFACLVWPATSRHLRRLVEFLVAMIFSKVIIFAGLSLAIASFASVSGFSTTAESNLAANGSSVVTAQNKDCQGKEQKKTTVCAGVPIAMQNTSADVGASGGNNDKPWYSFLAQLATTIVMFFLMALSPSMAMKMMGNIGMSEMAPHVTGPGGHLQRPTFQRQFLLADRLVGIKGSWNAIKRGRSQLIQTKADAKGMSVEQQRLEGLGIFGREVTLANGEKGVSYELTASQFEALGASQTEAAQLAALSRSGNANSIAFAHTAYALMLDGDFASGFYNEGDRLANSSVLRTRSGESVVLMDVIDRRTGKELDWHDHRTVLHHAKREKAAGAKAIRVLVANRGTNDGNPIGFTEAESKNLARLNKDVKNMSQVLNMPVRVVNDAPATIRARVKHAPSTVGGKQAKWYDY